MRFAFLFPVRRQQSSAGRVRVHPLKAKSEKGVFLRSRMLCGLLAVTTLVSAVRGEPWPRWRGPEGRAVSPEAPLPVRWNRDENIDWVVPVPGEGASSPIVWGSRVFLTTGLEDGTRRLILCLDLETGRVLWSRAVDDANPELASALTQHAAATPVTDGRLVVAFFGNAGLVCYDLAGVLQWRLQFGEFDSELGLATSPILSDGKVLLVCDHDGRAPRSFDSFLVAVDLASGREVWRTSRPGLFRSWSTPLVFSGAEGDELVVNAQDELRGYDARTGNHLWSVRGMTGWVTPSPVAGGGLVFATSGRDGPTLAVRPGGRGDVTDTHVVWKVDRGAPYVCSPLLYGNCLYVHSETGVLRCYEAQTGRPYYAERLGGRFMASAVAGDGKLYFTNDEGTTFVVRAGPEFALLARNPLGEECLASPAISRKSLLIRTRHHLFRVAGVPRRAGGDDP